MNGSVSEDAVLRKLLEHMNRQCPSRQRRLSELLQMPEPAYVGRDGREYAISKEELILMKNSLDILGISDIRLPILIAADSSHEQSVWRVEGEAECALVLHLLEKESTERKEKIFLYAPHMAALRRRVPTATVCILMP